jgi:hypothetical protein
MDDWIGSLGGRSVFHVIFEPTRVIVYSNRLQ